MRRKAAGRFKILAVIPARSGSRGIPNKNIRLLCDKPLIYYTIAAALQARLVDRVVVSTDSGQIAEIAKAYGAEVPFLRPAELARDDTPRLPVIRHAVSFLKENQNYRPEIIVTLQPTSPMRQAEHIDAAINMLGTASVDSVASVCEAEHSPYWMRRLGPRGTLVDVMPPGENNTRRQDLPKIYRLNGAIFAETYAALMEEETSQDRETRAFIMERKYSIDIDEDLDFQVAEILVGQMKRARMTTRLSKA